MNNKKAKYLIAKRGEYDLENGGVAYYVVGEAEGAQRALGVYAKLTGAIYDTDVVLLRVVDTLNDLEVIEK